MDAFVRLKDNERRDYFTETATRLSLAPRIIEKDLWVCWILKALFSIEDFKDSLIFKGGTSLSKAYDVIKRFSEDIDISISRESLGFGGESDPETASGSNERKRRIEGLKEACQNIIRSRLMPGLDKMIEEKLGSRDGWTLEIDNDDPDLQTMLFNYPLAMPEGSGGYIKPAVKIEMGARSDHWPSERRYISPYIAKTFTAAFVEPKTEVKVLSAQRTFWEKATILHAEYNRPSNKIMPERLSRHYYDLSRLIVSGLSEEAAKDLALLDRVVVHKKIFFPCSWAKYDEAKKGSLHLAPQEQMIEKLEKDYSKMREMFFTKPPVFSEIISILRKWENDFNQGA